MAEQSRADVYREVGLTPEEIAQVENVLSTPRDGCLRCEDCGNPYLSFPLDLMLPDEQWALIHPDGYGGVLCAQCIVARASRLPGATVVHARIDVPGDGWRDIASAPMDGTRVMVYACKFKRHWFGVGYYFKGVPGDGEGWVAHSFLTTPINDAKGSFTPTHWMPLPDPPAVHGTTDGE